MKKVGLHPDAAKRVFSSPGVVFFGGASLLLFSELIGTICSEVIGRGGDDPISLLVIILSALVVVWTVFWLIFRKTNFTWASIGYSKPSRPWAKKWFVSVVTYVLISTALVALASWLLPHFNSNQAQDVGLSGSYSLGLKIIGFVSLVILTPIFEETMFRGVLFKGLRRSMSFYPALIVTSLLFALAHGQLNVAIDTFALGLLLGYLTEKTGSIVPSILLHALKNSVAFIILFVVAR